MERVGDKVAANNKRKECNLSSKPEGHIMMESPIVYESMRGDWPESLPHKHTDITEDNNLGRCLTSLVGSELPHTSPCSINDTEIGIAVEELTVGNYKTSSLALGRSTRQGQSAHLYQLAGGSRCKASDGDSLPQDMDHMLFRVREQLAGMPPDRRTLNHLSSKQSDQAPGGISVYLRATGKKNISSDTLPIMGSQLKTLHTSNLSQLFFKRNLKGKEVVNKNPEAPCEFGGGIASYNHEKMDYRTKVASDALLKSSANNEMVSSHRVDMSAPKSFHDGISLREWLKPGGHKKNKVESLILFRQIVELVDLAHSQGFALQDLRPSCFNLLPSTKVIYSGSSAKKELESAVDQDLNKKRPLEQDMPAKYRGPKQQKVNGDMQYLGHQPPFSSSCKSRSKMGNEIDFCVAGSQDSGYVEHQCENHFDYRSISVTRRQQSISTAVRLEDKWYACPEELKGRDCTFSSNIYGLGVLLFELLCWFESTEMHSQVMSNLRHRILPSNFLSENPKEAGFCLWLLHPEHLSRPTTREILQSELICGIQEIFCKEDLSVYADNDDDNESELLFHFLISLKEQKQKHASKLVHDIRSLEEDINEADRRHLSRTSSVFSKAANGTKGQLHLEEPRSSVTHSRTFLVPNMNEKRLMRNISQLEDAYFSLRSEIHLTEMVAATRSDKDLLKSREMWSVAQNENERPSASEESVDRLGAFFEGLCKFSHYSKFENRGTITNGDLMNSANVICSLSFDRDEEYIAAAGVSKRIKIFEYGAFMNDSIDVHYPVVEMSNKSKLSCVCWNKYIKNYLASTDYDGVVQMWDVCTGQGFSQYKEHQKRAWSVDFSLADPTKFATGSDDCSVKLWSINEKSSIGTICNPANVCCVQFSASSNYMLAFGSADYKVYCYDLRHARIPWCTLAGHQKAVSYVKFLDSETLVSASTDNTLKLWDLNKTSSTGLSAGACTLTFSGHSNEKNFVGLSVLDGYIACGSETNEVYSYYRSVPMPIASYKFGSVDPISGHEIDDDNAQFVSSVCWRRKSNMLVAANSTGSMKLLQMV